MSPKTAPRPADTPSKASTPAKHQAARKNHPRDAYQKICRGRKQPVRGPWEPERNGRYYAQLTIKDPNTGAKSVRRVPLLDKDGQAVASVAQARLELDRLRTQRADDTLPCLRRTPKFADYKKSYLDYIKAGVGTKKASTISKEKSALARWAEDIGEVRLDKIRKPHVTTFIKKRLKLLEKRNEGKNRVQALS